MHGGRAKPYTLTPEQLNCGIAQEAKAKETIQQLKFEVGNLNRLVESGGGSSSADLAALDDLIAQKAALTAERDAQVPGAMFKRPRV